MQVDKLYSTLDEHELREGAKRKRGGNPRRRYGANEWRCAERACRYKLLASIRDSDRAVPSTASASTTNVNRKSKRRLYSTRAGKNSGQKDQTEQTLGQSQRKTVRVIKAYTSAVGKCRLSPTCSVKARKPESSRKPAI